MEDFRIAHFSPGRLRVRLAQVAQDPAFVEQLRQMLSSIEGIRKVSASAVTGSVLVEYDPEGLDLQSLLSLGRMLNIVPEDVNVPGGEGIAAGPFAAGMGRIGEVLGSALEQGGRVAGQVLNPRVAVPAMAFSAVVRGLGMKAALGVSPGVAAAWVLASLLVGPRRR